MLLSQWRRWSNTDRVVVAQTVLTLVIYERKEGGEDVTQLQLREEALWEEAEGAWARLARHDDHLRLLAEPRPLHSGVEHLAILSSLSPTVSRQENTGWSQLDLEEHSRVIITRHWSWHSSRHNQWLMIELTPAPGLREACLMTLMTTSSVTGPDDKIPDQMSSLACSCLLLRSSKMWDDCEVWRLELKTYQTKWEDLRSDLLHYNCHQHRGDNWSSSCRARQKQEQNNLISSLY